MLVAISIPIFTSQLEKAKEATDLANIRAAYAEASVQALENSGSATVSSVPMTQGTAGWTGSNGDALIGNVKVSSDTTLNGLTKGDVVKVTVSDAGTSFAK